MIMKKKNDENILVIGAHNDDYIIGAGGTLAKYIKEGKEVFSIIFSYGEKGLPQLKRKYSVTTRVKESKASDKIIGIKKSYYLGISEGRFEEEFRKKETRESLKRMIKDVSPNKIFMHSTDDAHKDHRLVNHIIMDVLEEIRLDCDVYTFQIWNVFSFRKKDKPQLVVDITDTFGIKRTAFYAHKSQKLVLLSLTWNLYLQAILNGWKNDTRYAEVFYREK